MPQPYRGGGDLQFGRGFVLHHPQLAAHIAEIASIWSFTDEAWAYLLGIMLNFEAGAGLTIYQALTGTGAQRAVLNEIADQYLPEQFRAEFGALTKASRRRAIERNAVVHGLWFVDPAMPDALILAPRHFLSSLTAKVFHRAAKARLMGVPTPTATLGNNDGWLVYRVKDMEAIERRLIELFRQIDSLIDKILAHSGAPPNPTLKRLLQSVSSVDIQTQTTP
jgi:hypothetical protein